MRGEHRQEPCHSSSEDSAKLHESSGIGAKAGRMGGLARRSRGSGGCHRGAGSPALDVLCGPAVSSRSPCLSLRALPTDGCTCWASSRLAYGWVWSVGSTSRRAKDGGKDQDICPLSARPPGGSGCVPHLKASAPVRSHPVVEATPSPCRPEARSSFPLSLS